MRAAKDVKTTAIVEDIKSGAYDSLLSDIEKAVADRLTTVRTSRSAKEYGLGDKVRFNSYCGTKYLHGHEAVVTGIKQKKLTVRLIKPVGRFVRYDSAGNPSSAEIDVPPSIVDLVL